MYRRIKKVVIVPLLILTLMSCMIYTDFRKPMEVEAVVLTGNPFADMFGWALELVGFSGKNKESQDQALHNFVQYIYKELHDLKGITEQMEEGRKEQFDAECKKWRSDMEKKWSSMSEKERTINCFNSYTEKEFAESGTNKSYYVWVKENYVNCTSNPFKEETSAIPLRLIIANAIRDGKISSKYTAEQWEQSGTLGILTMSVRDWISGISKDVYGAAEEIWNKTLGSLINTGNLHNMAWYQFLESDECYKVIDYFELGSESDTAKECLKNMVSTLLENIKGEEYSIYQQIGSKYLLKIMPIYLRGSFYEMAVMLTDIPDNTDSIKLVKGRSDYYYEIYDNAGNIIDDVAECQLIYGRKDGYFSRNVKFTNISSLSSYNIFSINTVNFYFAGGSTYNYGNIIIPFGMSDVNFTSDSLIYTPSNVYTGTYAGQDEDDPAVVTPPFDLVVTGHGDSLAKKIAGTVIDLDDVPDDAIPHDEVLDPDLTEEKVAAREDVNDKAITDAKLRADERIKEEAKDDAGTDAKPGEDTKDDDLDKYKIKVTDIFPFCIPFDIYRFFECLAADPVAPSFTIPVIVENSFGIPEYSVEIDFSKFDSVAAILRKMELLGFCVGLAFVTNKLIKH